jgi:tetratricopeptide (TPR) repeat protein
LADFVKSEKIGKARAEAVTLLNRANAAKAWSTALSIFREVPELDPGGDFELVVLWELSKCLDNMHRSFNAELYFFATLEHSQKKFGREFSNSYNCANCLGVLYENLGRLGEASAMYQRSIAGRAKVLGEWHWDTAMSLQELGTVNLRLEDYEATLPLFERALKGFENGEGPHRNFTLFVMSNLSNVYLELGMDEELRRLLSRLIPRAAEALGAEHPVTGEAVRKYIECCGKGDLPDGVARLIQGYRQSYEQTRSEVVRWVLDALHTTTEVQFEE